MVHIAVLTVQQTGDIGGTGVSRFAVVNNGSDPYTTTQLNAAALALLNMYTVIKASLPNNMLFAVQPIANVVEDTTAALVAQLNIPVTSSIQGQTAGSYTAGMGARMYWHTSVVRHRRLVRGATYMTPLIGGSFTSNGSISAVTAAAVQSAGNAYIAAINAATMVPMVLCRPTTKGGQDGLSAAIASCTVTTRPSGVRSRRS